MSSFYCETCGATISDTSDGYITGCEHHPLITRAQRLRIRAESAEKYEEELLLHLAARDSIGKRK